MPSKTFAKARTSDFIEVYDDALDAATCARIVERFTQSGAAQRGRSGGGVDPTIKDSWDITISDDPAWSEVEDVLKHALVSGLKRYAVRYPHLILGPFAMRKPDGAGGERLLDPSDLREESVLVPFLLRAFRPGRINLQRYVADQGGYPRWHSEHFPMMDNAESLHRVLLWSIYLNDSFREGETEFLYQARKIRPRTGSLLIAPSAFTHTHRGNRPQGGDKYIATSWVLFGRAEKMYGKT
jgi:hypothetical protein